MFKYKFTVGRIYWSLMLLLSLLYLFGINLISLNVFLIPLLVNATVVFFLHFESSVCEHGWYVLRESLTKMAFALLIIWTSITYLLNEVGTSLDTIDLAFAFIFSIGSFKAGYEPDRFAFVEIILLVVIFSIAGAAEPVELEILPIIFLLLIIVLALRATRFGGEHKLDLDVKKISFVAIITLILLSIIYLFPSTVAPLSITYLCFGRLIEGEWTISEKTKKN